MHVAELERYEKEIKEIDGAELNNGNKNKNIKHNNNGVWKMEEGNEEKKAYGVEWDWTHHLECGGPPVEELSTLIR